MNLNITAASRRFALGSKAATHLKEQHKEAIAELKQYPAMSFEWYSQYMLRYKVASTSTIRNNFHSDENGEFISTFLKLYYGDQPNNPSCYGAYPKSKTIFGDPEFAELERQTQLGLSNTPSPPISINLGGGVAYGYQSNSVAIGNYGSASGTVNVSNSNMGPAQTIESKVIMQNQSNSVSRKPTWSFLNCSNLLKAVSAIKSIPNRIKIYETALDHDYRNFSFIVKDREISESTLIQWAAKYPRSGEFITHPGFAASVITINPKILKYLPKDQMTAPEIKAAIKFTIQSAAKWIKYEAYANDHKFLIDLIKINPNAFQYICKIVCTHELAELAIRGNPFNIILIHNPSDLLDLAISINPKVVKYMNNPTLLLAYYSSKHTSSP
jgi:hypothetical protein